MAAWLGGGREDFMLPSLRAIYYSWQGSAEPLTVKLSVIHTLSAKYTTFHIVLQALFQIAIFEKHDKGIAAIASHILTSRGSRMTPYISFLLVQLFSCTCFLAVYVYLYAIYIKCMKVDMKYT